MVLADTKFSRSRSVTLMAQSSKRTHHKKVPKNLRNLRRTKLPPDFGVNLFLKKPSSDTGLSHTYFDFDEEDKGGGDESEDDEQDNDTVCESEELEAISFLFQGRIPQKPGMLFRERPLPLPLPHKLRPLKLPMSKKHVPFAAPKIVSSRASICKQVYKNPNFLISLATEIKALTSNEDVSVVLDKCPRFLRKGS
ncbi:pentatricopeptide repeat-containing protein At2g01860-like [Pistacia vera]|uniref:pentatricopeptide repeat-containing protein At2g01860-like n=1 Tax=Pistacia vera TaxID=55513 RepID=UPI0012635E44|nr:pentatricopeptide repeat-containing protein At2g01860-like [Pistacia vera]